MSLLARFRRLPARFWLTFLLAAAVVEGGEFLFDRAVASGSHETPFVDSLFSLSGLYQRVLAAPRKPVVRSVAIVEIDPETDIPSVSSSNVCGEREFLSRLLAVIDKSEPPLIVVDKYFGAFSCAASDSGTQHLRDTVAMIRAERRAVIVGVRAKDGPAGHSLIEPALAFDGPAGQEGVVNIAKDNRRLPLQWLLYQEGGGDTASPVVRDTLALTAAKAYEPRLFQRSPLLAKIITNGEQPFIGFLRTEQFAINHYYASEVLCGRRLGKGEPWETCAQGSPLDGLAHKIVLVAENDRDRDEHHSIIGIVPGFYLQANYVEALLDDRYYRPGGAVLDYGFGFAFLLALELILVVDHRHMGQAVALVAALCFVSYAAIYLIIMHVGWYIDPVPVGVTAVLIKILHGVYGYVRTEKPARRAEVA